MTFENFRRDIAYAIRGLRSKPGFTIAVVVTLALGIGAGELGSGAPGDAVGPQCGAQVRLTKLMAKPYVSDYVQAAR